MKKLIIKNKVFSRWMVIAMMTVSAVVAFTACNEDYDEHFSSDSAVYPGIDLLDIIKNNPDLSVFYSLLQETGYDVILASRQAFTVFAPTNDALAGLDRNDKELVKRVVQNHIARFLYSASNTETKTIYMQSLKKLQFVTSVNGSTIGGVALAQPNIAADNGIVHIVNQQLPLVDNIWELLKQPGYESIKDYMYSYTKDEFSVNQSELIDVNENGDPVYDSVFVSSNDLWYIGYYATGKGVGYLNNEDSTYTMFVPSETAWQDAYAKASPFFVVREDIYDYEATQEENTKYSIIKSLVFRGKLDPATVGDSLINTRGEIIYNPSRLFEGTTRIETSNGLVYRMDDKYNFEPTDAWHRKIVVEAEDPTGRDNDTGTGTVFTRYTNNHPEVSESRFIEVIASSTGARPYVQFEIPNTLAGKYDMTAVFLPNSVNNTDVQDSTKVRYTVYEKRAGSWTTIKSGGGVGTQFTSVDGSPVTPTIQTHRISTDGTPWEFAYANYMAEETTIRVRISVVMTPAELRNGYTNNMRIDCIVLEPYKE